MSKTPADELVDEILEELTTYIRDGTINTNRIARALSFEELEIDEFDRLKRIHFVLHPDVVQYVRQLPERLRNIKRESERRKHRHRHVEGKIDWGATTKLRYSDNYGDPSVFVCDSPHLEYDIPENLVLKKLLAVIYRTMREDIQYIDYTVAGDTDPSRTWVRSSITELESIFERNVHLDRIRAAEEIDLTGRHLEAARRSREPLYQEAHDLFRIYDNLMRNRLQGDAGEVLQNTLLVPERTHRLFELYVVFTVLRALKTHGESLTLQPIGSDTGTIARAENDERSIEVYHDDTGSLEFEEQIETQDPTSIDRSRFLERHREASIEYAEFSKRLTGDRRSMYLYRGRPDFIVEEYRTAKETTLDTVIIGEVKYTESKSTFFDGLEQLTEYLNYCRKNDTYVKETETELIGMLVTDGVETSNFESSTLVHRTTSDLRSCESSELVPLPGW